MSFLTPRSLPLLLPPRPSNVHILRLPYPLWLASAGPVPIPAPSLNSLPCPASRPKQFTPFLSTLNTPSVSVPPTAEATGLYHHQFLAAGCCTPPSPQTTPASHPRDLSLDTIKHRIYPDAACSCLVNCPWASDNGSTPRGYRKELINSLLPVQVTSRSLLPSIFTWHLDS